MSAQRTTASYGRRGATRQLRLAPSAGTPAIPIPTFLLGELPAAGVSARGQKTLQPPRLGHLGGQRGRRLLKERPRDRLFHVAIGELPDDERPPPSFERDLQGVAFP